jgi:hypothetical protein
MQENYCPRDQKLDRFWEVRVAVHLYRDRVATLFSIAYPSSARDQAVGWRVQRLALSRLEDASNPSRPAGPSPMTRRKWQRRGTGTRSRRSWRSMGCGVAEVELA